ncbi:hypothetical protein [Ramlibacter sp. AN1133]|uniref:hypothetical protein n=1 Tax=Ramlibacter sp. AN1133 TaxID=3133429 RepID=UPI0030BD1D7C
MSEHAVLFDAALNAAQRAWHGTAMFARARQERGAQLLDLLYTGTPAQWTAYVTDMAGAALAGPAVSLGLDAQKASRVGALVLQMAWSELPQVQAERSPAAALQRLESGVAALRHWVTTGEGAPGGDLGRSGALVGQAGARLALIAPLVSALGVCLVVVKAQLAGAQLGGLQ